MLNLEKYRGTKVEKTKKELENLGFNVVIKTNHQREMQEAVELVVRAMQFDEKTIEIIAGSFKFLTDQQ